MVNQGANNNGIKCTKVKQRINDRIKQNYNDKNVPDYKLSGNEKFNIEQKVDKWQAKQELMQQHRDRMKKKKDSQEQ